MEQAEGPTGAKAPWQAEAQKGHGKKGNEGEVKLKYGCDEGAHWAGLGGERHGTRAMEGRGARSYPSSSLRTSLSPNLQVIPAPAQFRLDLSTHLETPFSTSPGSEYLHTPLPSLRPCPWLNLMSVFS